MFGLFVLLVVIMNYAFTRTKWGRSMMAVGGNAEAARRAGINVGRIYLSAFMLCSMFAALGGMLSRRAARLVEPAGGHRRRQPQRDRGGGHRRHQPVRRPRQRLVGAARDHRHPVDLERADAAEPLVVAPLHDHRRRARHRRDRRQPRAQEPRLARPRLIGREHMTTRLNGKVAAVTGAASGIGLACAKAMLARRRRAWC